MSALVLTALFQDFAARLCSPEFLQSARHPDHPGTSGSELGGQFDGWRLRKRFAICHFPQRATSGGVHSNFLDEFTPFVIDGLRGDFRWVG